MAKYKSKETKQLQPQVKPIKSSSIQFLNRDFVFGFLLFIATFIAYQPAWNGTPIWDDDGHITKPELRSLSGFAHIWTQLGATQQYYPLMHSIFWLEYHLWGDSTLGYHLVNILLHFFSALLLVCILRRLAIPGAWFVAAVFALHPVQAESVAWISELKNTLSGVFFLSTILVYLKFDSERKRKLYIIAIGLFILGLMSKSVIATLPVALLVIIWWKQGKINWKNDVIPLLPFFAVGIASGLFTSWVERKFIGAQGNEFNFTIIERCLIAGRVTWFYLSKIFLPMDLIFIYPRWTVSQTIWWQYLFPFATLILMGALWISRNRSRAPLSAFLFFSALLFPVLGFFNVYPFRFSFVADHFQYLACIGPIVILSVWIFGLLKGSLRSVICAAILLTLGALTWKQSETYSDAETLYRTTIKKNPACWMAYNNLGKLLAENGRMDGVMSDFQMALKINPAYQEAHYNLGIVLAKMGRTDEAVAQYRKAIEIKPDYSDAYNNLGLLVAGMGQIDEAIGYYRKSLEIKPRFAEAWNNLGNALSQSGQTDEAITYYRKALNINSNYAEAHYNFGLLLSKIGRTDEAIVHYQKALEINPRDCESQNAFGLLLAQIGRNDESISHYRKALEINVNFIEAQNNLGLILAKIGQTDEAIFHYRKALEIDPDNIIIMQNLADALEQQNQVFDAVSVLQKALQLAKSAGQQVRVSEITATLEKLNQASHSIPQAP
jgi:tetratricopeptide (TPR) repeat protein